MGKVRVYELAKQMGLENKDLLTNLPMLALMSVLIQVL